MTAKFSKKQKDEIMETIVGYPKAIMMPKL